MTSYGFGPLSVFYNFFPSNLGVQAKRESRRQGHKELPTSQGKFLLDRVTKERLFRDCLSKTREGKEGGASKQRSVKRP